MTHLVMPKLVAMGRDYTSNIGRPFRCSIWARGCFSERPVSQAGRKMMIEKLWRELFSDPSQWWDHRSHKADPKHPDFKHKKTQQSLWIVANLTPSWVESELAAMAPSLLQSHSFSWNVRLRKLVKVGDYKMALNLFQQMQREGMILDKFTFVPVLNACSNLRLLEKGRRVHEQIIQKGYEYDVYVATSLVDMYVKCGSIGDALNIFNKISERDVVSWSTMIVGYVKSEQGLKALEFFRKMQQEGVEPDAVTFVGVLNACGSVAAIEQGRRIHDQIIEKGCESDVHVATCLVHMYAKCGSIEEAWSVFNKMRERNVVSWNAMIRGCVKSEQVLKAMDLFREMQQEGVEPNAVTFVEVLNACANVAALDEGRRVHEQVIRRGLETNVYVATCLVDMYAKCGSIEDAWRVFNKMRVHNVVSWSAMIGAYVKSEQGLKAMELFRGMQQEGVEPNAVTFVAVLKACASVASLEEGRRVHEQIIQRGYDSNVYVASCLVDMYAKCGNIEDALRVFNKMRDRNVVSWSAMIGGYVRSGQGLKAIEFFQKMQQGGMEPDTITFVEALNACASVAALEEGKYVHRLIIERRCESNVLVANCLVDMYAKCGSINDAWNVFSKMQERNVVSWSIMIGVYVKSEQGLKAMELFREMQQQGVEPNTVTFVGVLNACASVAALEEGRRVHEQIIHRGLESDIYVANSLVDMYAKCGTIENAWSVFNKMPVRDVISWNALIGGYAKHGHLKKAIRLLKRMHKEGIEVNEITFTCLLSACSHRGLVKEGLRYFYSMTSCYDVRPTVEHYACIVDLLGRAGWLEEAEEIMVRMPMEGDSTLWMSLLGSCRTHGNLEMGERAAKMCWKLDPENASGYVLLLNIYAAAGKQEKSAAMQEERLEEKLVKLVELSSK